MTGRGLKQQLFVCDCGDVSHQFIVSWYKDNVDWNDELYIQVHLNQSMGFWKRLWHGIKYIFGFKCRFGSFDEVLLKPKEVERLQKALDEFVKFDKNRLLNQIIA